jgi:hypothetical protein
MTVTRKSNVIRVTADNDTISIAGSGLRIKTIRLVGGVDASTARIKETDTNGAVLFALNAAAAGVDELNLDGLRIDVATLHVDLTGTAPEVFIYVE